MDTKQNKWSPPQPEPIISDSEQEYLIEVYHSTRLAQKLTHIEALRCDAFWKLIQQEMMVHNRLYSPYMWKLTWQRMRSKLWVRIEKAFRQKRADSSWLTLHNVRLLAVLLDELAADRLDYVERCMVDDVLDDDDRLVLCAAVYRDVVANRFVLRCQHCREVFSDEKQLLAHVQQYFDVEPEDGEYHSHQMMATSEAEDDDVPICEPVKQTLRQSSDRALSMAAVLKPAVRSTSVNIQSNEPMTPIIPADVEPSHMGLQEDDKHSSSSSSAEEDTADGFMDVVTSQAIDLPKIYKCELCPEMFSTQLHRNKHSLLAHDRRALQCPDCPSSFAKSSALLSHSRLHTNPLQCDICQAKLPGKSELGRHMRRHNDSKECICPHCNMAFQNTLQRNKHQYREHGGGLTRNQVCEHCGKAFRWPKDLRDHIVLVHRDKLEEAPPVFKCEQCVKEYRTKKCLYKHQTRSHKHQ